MSEWCVRGCECAMKHVRVNHTFVCVRLSSHGRYGDPCRARLLGGNAIVLAGG